MSALYNSIKIPDQSEKDTIKTPNFSYRFQKHMIGQIIDKNQFMLHKQQEVLRQRLRSVSLKSVLSPMGVFNKDDQYIKYEDYITQTTNQSTQTPQNDESYKMIVYHNNGLVQLSDYLIYCVFAPKQTKNELLISFQILIKIYQNLIILFQNLIKSNLISNISQDLNINNLLVDDQTQEICLFDFQSFKCFSQSQICDELDINMIFGNLVYNALTLSQISKATKNQKVTLKVFKMNCNSIMSKSNFYRDLIKIEQQLSQCNKDNSIQNYSFVFEVFQTCLDIYLNKQPITFDQLENIITSTNTILIKLDELLIDSE